MEFDPDKIVSLMDTLGHPDKAAVRAAVDYLIGAGADHEAVHEQLVQLLSDPSCRNKWPVAYILAHLPNPSSLCVKVLLETLGTDDPDIRWAVLLLLVRLGKENREVVAGIVHLVRSGTPDQRRMAVYGLRDLNLGDQESLQALLEALEDPEPLVRVAAVTSVQKHPEAGRPGMRPLLRLLQHDPDSRVRCSAALALGNLGQNSEEIRAVLTAAARGSNPQLKKAARSALALLRKKCPPHR